MTKGLNVVDSRLWTNILNIIDALPFYAMLVDEHHYIVQANKAIRSHLGVNRRDIIGQYCPKVVHGIDGPFYGCPLEESVEKGQAIEREVFDKESGRWLRSAIYPTKLLTKEGDKIYFHMVIDITAHKQAEDELKASQERFRSLSTHLESVIEEERRKIARDLHDETSQIIASIDAHLEAAINKLPANANQVIPILKKAQNFSVQILDQIHRLVYQLRPTILDDFGLVAAIRWLLEHNLGVAGIDFDFEVIRQERALSTEIRTATFRVVQEIINNILRHANAKNVIMRLHFQKRALRVWIKDDGVGFQVEDAMNSKDRPRGLGLIGIQERIRTLNGTLEIQSSSGYGTEINFQIPYDSDVLPK